MNEHVNEERGALFACKVSGSGLDLRYEIDPKSLEATVRRVMAMSEEEKRRRGANARKYFEESRQAFGENFIREWTKFVASWEGEGRPVEVEGEVVDRSWSKEKLARAREDQRGGRGEEAEGIYREILGRDAGHPEALHFLGLLFHQRGENEKAIEWIGRSIEADGEAALFRNNLGNVYFSMERFGEAAEQFEEALRIRPEYELAETNLEAARLRENAGRKVGDGSESKEGCTALAAIAEGWQGQRCGEIAAPVSAGELIDKITILRIKAERLTDPVKLGNVRKELDALLEVQERRVPVVEEVGAMMAQLQEVNEMLWRVEDEIRECERGGDFGEAFVELARSVYRHNDRRAELKRGINAVLGSRLVEEKSYV